MRIVVIVTTKDGQLETTVAVENLLIRIHFVNPFEDVDVGRSVELLVVSDNVSRCQREHHCEQEAEPEDGRGEEVVLP